MTWYEASSLGRIKAVEVESATAKTVTIRGRRQAIHASYSSLFPTWEEAHAHLLARAEADAERARSQLERVEGRLENVRRLRRLA